MNKTLFAFAIIGMAATACHKTSGGGNMADRLNSKDSLFIQKATRGNLAEIAAGKIADSLAGSDSVKMFGQEMVTDHGNAQASLDSIGNKWNIALPASPDSAHLAAAAVLRTLSGAAFDSAYLAGQWTDHQAAQTLYQDEIQQGSSTQVLTYAKRILPVVQMHIAMLDSLMHH